MSRYIFIALLFSCQSSPNTFFSSFTCSIPTYEYSEMNAPSFLDSLFENHSTDFGEIYRSEFERNLGTQSLSKIHEENFQTYLFLKVLHELFTSQGASNCTVGKIWNIPYMWHWIEPNPRHEIILASNNQMLTNEKAPKGFGRYKSYADLDRTPSIYLGDFFGSIGKFKSKDCTSFSGFGWCSEREMSFVALLQIKGFKAKVKSQNGHSWTEVVTSLENQEGSKQLIKFKIDNTFDSFSFSKISKSEVAKWEKDLGDSKTQKWYNEKAFSKSEQNVVKQTIVTKKVSVYLEKQVVAFLNREL